MARHSQEREREGKREGKRGEKERERKKEEGRRERREMEEEMLHPSPHSRSILHPCLSMSALTDLVASVQPSLAASLITAE